MNNNKRKLEDDAWSLYAFSVRKLVEAAQDIVEAYESRPYPPPEERRVYFDVLLEDVVNLQHALAEHERAVVRVESLSCA